MVSVNETGSLLGSGEWPWIKPFSHGLSCVKDPKPLVCQFSDSAQQKGAFSFPGRTPGDTKGLHGQRGRKHRPVTSPDSADPSLIQRTGVVTGTW